MQEIVSVIIPVYNGEKTIEKAIESVVLQTYVHIEIIIVDDCSTDKTYDVIKELAARDQRIKYYRNKKNLGVAISRNFGCSKASGRYIAFLDSDDEWYPQKLQTQLKYLQEGTYDLCYTSYKMCDKKKNMSYEIVVPHTITYEGLLKENVICCSTVLIKRDFLGREPFCKDFFHEDFILWLDLLKKGVRTVGIPECLIMYSKGGRSADKFNAMRYRWLIYRKYEQLNIIKSTYYFFIYSVNGIKKYIIKKQKAKYIGKKSISKSVDYK